METAPPARPGPSDVSPYAPPPSPARTPDGEGISVSASASARIRDLSTLRKVAVVLLAPIGYALRGGLTPTTPPVYSYSADTARLRAHEETHAQLARAIGAIQETQRAVVWWTRSTRARSASTTATWAGFEARTFNDPAAAAPVNGDYPKFNGTAWVPSGGGSGRGGGGIDGFDAHALPTSLPTTYYAWEFDGTDTPTITTTNVGTATYDVHTTVPSAMVLTVPTGTTVYRGWMWALPATLTGDFTAVLALDMLGTLVNFCFGGLTLADGTSFSSAKAVHALLGWHVSTTLFCERYTGTTLVTSGARLAINVPQGFVRLRRVGSTTYCGYSRTGRTWIEAALPAGVLDYNPTHIGLHALNDQPATATLVARWLRVVVGDGNYNGWGL